MSRLLLAVALLWGTPADSTRDVRDEGRAEGGNPDCIDYWGEARYGAYGYDHIVHVENGCDALAHCEVWTNVNEDRTPVDVPAGEHEAVVTWRGSPAREFTAHAACELER